jgi:hypothetical protein
MASIGQGNVHIYDTAVTDTSTTAQGAKEMLGAIRVEHDGTTGAKHYMYVKATEALVKGDVVQITGETGYQVGKPTVESTAGALMPVGVCIGTIASGSFGWVQTKGHCPNIRKTSNACITAHGPLIFVSGKIQGRYINTWSGSALIFDSQSARMIKLVDIHPFESVSNKTASCSGYLNLS